KICAAWRLMSRSGYRQHCDGRWQPSTAAMHFSNDLKVTYVRLEGLCRAGAFQGIHPRRPDRDDV
ncbi:MAG: hypothetical protein OXC91_02860, partial [Rhodobacteraceae bacterium]|nr:hypothetical protein [Paracoccaceae bacterium]